jgi:hypothetical protein
VRKASGFTVESLMVIVIPEKKFKREQGRKWQGIRN